MYKKENNSKIFKKFISNNNKIQQIIPIDSNALQISFNKKNIQENSLFNITYSCPKKEKINFLKLNNFIINKKPPINGIINNDYQEDQRLFYSLKMLGLDSYYANFVQKKLNFEGLLTLTNDDMEKMKIPLNLQKKIQKFILEYLHFANLYTLEEIKKFFSRDNNNLKRIKNYRRFYSYDT